MTGGSALETLLKRDRAVVFAGLAGVSLLAWTYILVAAAEMGGMTALGMGMQIRPWSGLDFGLMFLMWAVMMVAMMLPSAAPMILLFAAIRRKQQGKQQEGGQTFAPVSAFLAGYVAVWSAFSLAATLLQWGLEQAALLSPMMVVASPLLGGGLLVAAGLYQWSPLKQACLKHCRSPIHFIVHRRRDGSGGAFVMGLEHGAFCLGCCWILMGLLFVGGVMNLLWVAAIAAFVLLEKLLPFGALAGRLGGALLAGAGLLVLFQA
jgi:predicted metal-binding membrane protein